MSAEALEMCRTNAARRVRLKRFILYTRCIHVTRLQAGQLKLFKSVPYTFVLLVYSRVFWYFSRLTLFLLFRVYSSNFIAYDN